MKNQKIFELESKEAKEIVPLNYSYAYTVWDEGELKGISGNRLETIWSDGHFSNYREELMIIAGDTRLLLHKWSMWQGEKNMVRLVSRKEAIKFLINSHDTHPKRAVEGLRSLGHYIPPL